MPRRLVFIVSLLTAALALGATAFGQSGSPAAAPTFDVGTSPSRDAQLNRLSDELRALVPTCPFLTVQSAAEAVLNDLVTTHPEELDALATPAAISPELKSALLRKAGAQLTAENQAGVRDELARARLRLALTHNPNPLDSAKVFDQIKSASQVYYRRLVEGRLDDDELDSLIKRVSQPAKAAEGPKTTAPKVLTAAEIVSEVARHNQTGNAWQNLRAYTLEGTLKTAAGVEQHVYLFKMRPDRFRIQVAVEGKTFLVFASNGTSFWQQSADRTPRQVDEKSVGDRRYLGEFQDPLFGANGASFERLTDGQEGDRKVFRLKVTRADGTTFVASIDQENFHQIVATFDNGVVSHFSDFREVGGITFAFREETKDAEGRTGVLQWSRCAPNPGMVQAFFEPTRTYEPLYAWIETSLSERAKATEGKK